MKIVMGTSRPAPYLLFGPPGTGKTVTIVEAILQALRYLKNSIGVVFLMIRWINRLVQENDRQRVAVMKIVMGTSRPAPYLLFGPPGTGKTVTIVEAILQILKTNNGAKVLVTAPSNAAVDVISSRLLKYLSPTQLMRIYSSCREWSQIPEIMKDSCNYDSKTGNFEIPEGSEIIKYKVIAVTMITAGRLIEKKIPQNHFSHIFIDECAQGLEPEALISVGGLLGSDSPKSPPKSLLVLSGDPLQLGPVLRSPIAKKLGLEKSLLERLMTSVDLYQRDEGNNYNPDVLTKLVKNFRSHPAILDLPNRLFYQGELMPSGERGITHSACNWEFLPKKGVPIIFHGVEGKEERDHHSPSYFNTSEIHQVVRYLKEILDSKFSGAKIPESEIGIISPYRRQVQKIRASISKNRIGKDVSVASVEEFQGQERRVIIISTVRSDPQRINLDRVFRLGFLREPKRFNVAVTRAKSLLIIIGNPNILQGDPCWGELLKYCIKLGCYTGVPFKLDESFSDEEEEEDEDDDDDDDLPIQLRNTASNPDFGVNSVVAKMEKLSVKANDVSAVTKMIDPPWESHE
ncbi:hypothetical protein J437_LFUL015531 [Ladona fulva]|uniref:RNA helicase n=1 Tax=Ladona fulva TaxID=123851 RepID=A0A8K0KH30_LADFU|nr:hypothetical protein J437_LFUL015531 [Ladona fulva]